MRNLAEGTCGSCVWTIDINRTLTIRPMDRKGTLESIHSVIFWPWDTYRRIIRKTVVEEGVKAGELLVGIFRNMRGCREFDVGHLDVSDTENMGYAFFNCENIESIPSIAQWDTSNARTMGYMFYGCSRLTDISCVAGWNTENVRAMTGTFAGCRKLTDISPLAGWKTCNVRNMDFAFMDCVALRDVSPLENWDTKNAVSAQLAFCGCKKLRNADAIGNWDVRSMKDCYSIFRDTGVKENRLSEKMPMICPRTGPFTGYKKCMDGAVVELLITEDARRSSACGRKCRCDKAVVIRITNRHGLEVQKAVSEFDSSFIYRKGETVSVPDFDPDRFNECSAGIHFFMTKEEAESY